MSGPSGQNVEEELRQRLQAGDYAAARDLLEADAARARRRLRLQQNAMGILGILVCLGGIASLIARVVYGQKGFLSEWQWVLPVGYVLLTITGAYLGSRVLYRRANDLAQLDDVRMVGPLADLLQFGGADAQWNVRKALTRLLPRLRASDHGLLNDAQRALLCRQLTGTEDESADFQVAILRALEQVGDEKALPVVERLAAKDTPHDPAALRGLEAKDPEVRRARVLRDRCQGAYRRAQANWRAEPWERMQALRRDYEEAQAAYRALCDAALHRVHAAARECLSALRERVEASRQAHTLLRPADTPDTLLLRPAQGAAESDPALLLRPAGSGNEGEGRGP